MNLIIIVAAVLLLLGAGFLIYQVMSKGANLSAPGVNLQGIAASLHLPIDEKYQGENLDTPANLEAFYLLQLGGKDRKCGKWVTSCQSSLLKVVELLQGKFHTVEIFYSKDEESAGTGAVFLTIKNVLDGKDYIGFVGLWWRYSLASSIKPGFIPLNDSSRYIDKNKKVAICHQAVILHPDPSLNAGGIKVHNLREALASSKVEFSVPQPVRQTLYRLLKRQGLHFLQPATIKDNWLLDEGTVKVNYPNIEISYKNILQKWPVEEVLFLAQTVLKNKSSLGIGGVTGTGKTRLMEHLLGEIGKDANIRLIYTTHTVIGEMLQSDFDWTIFNAPFGVLDKENFVNVLVIDQAEEALKESSADMLALMDGPTAHQYNLAFMFTFNGNKAEFPPALFRSGRCLHMEILPISIKDADVIGNRLMQKEDSKLTFDVRGFSTFLKSKPDGGITLAEIYGFNQPIVLDKIGEQIAKIKQKLNNPEGFIATVSEEKAPEEKKAIEVVSFDNVQLEKNKRNPQHQGGGKKRNR